METVVFRAVMPTEHGTRNADIPGNAMDPKELRILKEIEAGMYEDDSDFATRIAEGPRLSVRYKAGLALAATVGITLLMLFPTHLAFGVAGYITLVAVGTNVLRHRSPKPAEVSPLEVFHRLTASLFRNTETAVDTGIE
jgi:hypothetical protein